MRGSLVIATLVGYLLVDPIFAFRLPPPAALASVQQCRFQALKPLYNQVPLEDAVAMACSVDNPEFCELVPVDHELAKFDMKRKIRCERITMRSI